jgi:hypothetical protein
MAYTTATDLRTYLGLHGTDEESLLNVLIGAAEAAIDGYCHRTFAALYDTTRTFEAQYAAQGAFLLLDADLCLLTSVTNGDDAATTLDPASYVLVTQDPPYEALRLRPESGITWQGTISVTGRWAYSLNPPSAIIQATRDYAAFLYRAGDTQSERLRRGVETGLPLHLRQLLAPYQRLR